MAEPDLAPLVLAGKDVLLSGSETQRPSAGNIADVDKLRSDLPELPMKTRSRLNTQYGVYNFYVIVCMYVQCVKDEVQELFKMSHVPEQNSHLMIRLCVQLFYFSIHLVTIIIGGSPTLEFCGS